MPDVDDVDDADDLEEIEPTKPPPLRVPKLIGYDAECGNFIVGARKSAVNPYKSSYVGGDDEFYGATGFMGGSDSEAASTLLEHVDGVTTRLSQARDKVARKKAAKMAKKAARGGDLSYGMWYRGYGRKWLTNGGCAYIDCQKLELCTPIVRSAIEHVKYAHAMFNIAREARELASAAGKDINVLLNNSDGHGNSWGTHVNMLVTRRCWENMFHRKLQYLMYLAAYQVSSIVFSGQGKVGSENEEPWVDYQLSQRADFFEVMVGEQTTHNRPIVNSRDESLCGDSYAEKTSGLAKLHCIFYDQNLCHTAAFLRVGVLQVIMAMIEAEEMDPNLLLDDPLLAVKAISSDPSLSAKVRTAGGAEVTAVELQFGFLAAAKRFATAGGLDDVVPGHEMILSKWEEVLCMLRDGDTEGLASKLDWVLKKLAIERAMEQGGFGWDSAEAKKLDHKYSDLADGLYFAYEAAGVTDQLVGAEEIERAMDSAPVDTRSWFVGEMLKRSENDEVEIDDVDWDEISFKFPAAKSDKEDGEIKLSDPLSHTMAMCQTVLDGDGTMEEKLAKLGLKEKAYSYSSYKSYGPYSTAGKHYDFRGEFEGPDSAYEHDKGNGHGSAWTH